VITAFWLAGSEVLVNGRSLKVVNIRSTKVMKNSHKAAEFSGPCTRQNNGREDPGHSH
jgi:hypothetical protein